MTWHLLMKTLTVKDGERALLTRNGRLERVLEPGRHRLFDLQASVDGGDLQRRSHRIPRGALRRAEGRAARSGRRAVRGGRDEGERNRHRQPRRPPCAPDDALAGARLLEGRNLGRCRAHRCGQRSPRDRASPGDDRAQPSDHRDGSGGREPRGRSALCRGPAGGAACARPARLLDRRPQDRGQAPRSASAGGRDHRAGNADQGSHRAAGDPDGIPPDRRPRARGRGRARRGCVAVPAGAVRDPRGGCRPHARRGAVGEGGARCGAAGLCSRRASRTAVSRSRNSA